MNNINFRGWDKKPRTLLRYIKIGDIFCFKVKEDVYYFGRIIGKSSFGHFAEIFSHSSDNPNFFRLAEFKRLGDPVILDSYSLFDRKAEGDWRIVGNQTDYAPPIDEEIFFSSGIGGGCKKVDIFDREFPIDSEEADNFPSYSPMGDSEIKRALGIC